MKVKTAVGEFVVPERVSPRAKYWAEALHNVVRIEELYGLVQVMLDEAFYAGRAEALNHFMAGLAEKLAPEVVDVEWTEVTESAQGDIQEGDEGSAGPEHPEPVAVSQADGSAEPTLADSGVHGGAEQGSGS